MPPGSQIVVLAPLAGALVAAATWILVQPCDGPDVRERGRRFHVNSSGRLGDGLVTDVAPGVIYYSYAVEQV